MGFILSYDQGLAFGDCLLLSALLHRPHKAAGYTVPTATAPLRGLLHCLPCVAKMKEANNLQMADLGGHSSEWPWQINMICARPYILRSFILSVLTCHRVPHSYHQLNHFTFNYCLILTAIVFIAFLPGVELVSGVRFQIRTR